MNKAGEKPLSLIENGKAKPAPKSSDLLAEADLSRFDKAKKKKKTTIARTTVSVMHKVATASKQTTAQKTNSREKAVKTKTDSKETTVQTVSKTTADATTTVLAHNREKTIRERPIKQKPTRP